MRFLHDGPGKWSGIVVGVALAVLIGALTLVVYNSGESRLRGRLGPQVWVHRCIDPTDPRAWLFVLVSDDDVTVLGRRNHVRDRWPLADIADVAVGRVVIGIVEHTCLVIEMRSGNRVRLSLPSRSTLSYPRRVADEAREEIQSRLAEVPV